jgi:excinuclease ABC subunit A
MTQRQPIILKNVRVHNLKGIDLELSPNQLIVFTGVSGSGKTSLAFDTIYVEGQRRYIESLSTYARRYMGDLPKPEADHISGISPTIAIEQKSVGKNPRSIVGTLTGVYDYLRVLFAKIAMPHCPVSGEALLPQSEKEILQAILSLPKKTKIVLLAPYIKGKKGSLKEDLSDLLRKGFMRIRLDGKILDLSEEIEVNETLSHDVDLVIDRFTIQDENISRITEAVIQALELGKGLLFALNAETQEETLFSKFAYAKHSKLSYPPLEPQDFSFNHPQGMCAECQGLGLTQEFDLSLIIDEEKSIAEDCCHIASSYQTVKWGNIYQNLASLYKFSVDAPWKTLSKAAKNIFLYGCGDKWLRMRFVHPTKGTVWYDYIKWKGVIGEAKKRFQEATSDLYRDNLSKLMKQDLCSQCRGARLKPYPASAKLCGKKIHEITHFTIAEALSFFSSLTLKEQEKLIAEDLVKEILKRLYFLDEVGLSYLSLDRGAPTLSGGEAQRVRLASHIGSGLIGTTYVLDEPSIGLHPRDNTKLINTLKALRNKGNTVIVVEHDEEMIWAADAVVDIGPGAGSLGGKLLVNGPIEDLLKSKQSITGAYLRGEYTIPIPKVRRSPHDQYLKILKASHHNLKKIDVTIPLGLFVCITGVSGSGKSSLITDILYPKLANTLHRAELPVGAHQSIEGLQHLNKVICIDQAPIGRTPRSNPATYIKVFDDIRDLFAKLKESQAYGYTPGHFSFNVLEGSCLHCKGMGFIKIDMDFMEDAWVSCPVCQGKRFDQKILSITFKGKNIYDILEMSIEEALVFFSEQPPIHHALEILQKVGLGYVKLGQSSTTLSGGEAQRIKLAKELIRPSTGKTLYILDEPTTGLHFHDIVKLLDILQALVDQKNSVVVIEHHMDFVKACDWVIDLGPEGGDKGGEILAEGPPDMIAKKHSPTGHALKEAFTKKTFTSSQENTEKNLSSSPIPITIVGASQNNLKSLSLSIPQGKITVCTGPSGSGKSSLAFETIYAEGQRRYVESLSTYARQFVKQMPKAKVESIEGLSPAIAIEQKHHAGNPRSTVGTMTESYDYLRVLYARLGTAYCPETKEEIKTITKESVVNKLLTLKDKSRLVILAPLSITKSSSFAELKEKLQKEGYLRIRLNNTYYELDEEIPYDNMRKNQLCLVIDRILVKDNIQKRLHEALDRAAILGGGIFIVSANDEDYFFNLSFAVESTGKSYSPITPQTFSFNADEGMCPECLGLGFQWGTQCLDDPEISLMTPSELLSDLTKEYLTRSTFKLFMTLLTKEGIDPDLPLNELNPKHHAIFLHGSERFHKMEGLSIRWQGIYPTITQAARAGSSTFKKTLAPLLKESLCVSCQGSRLNPLARHVKIQNTTLPELCAMSIEDACSFLQHLSMSEEQRTLLQETQEQLLSRLNFLCRIGLEYLSLDRSAPTLSGGETQRIYLARQLGSGLTGTLYVLDEPTIGLHPHNNHLLNTSLQHLRDLGNTLLLVEHDPLTIQIADYILDFGPGAGKQGGYITAQGTLKELMNNPQSLTGSYLNNTLSPKVLKKKRSEKGYLKVTNASIHNLKNLSVNIKVGCLTCISGVSGSGKSSLMHDIIKKEMAELLKKREKNSSLIQGAEHFDKLICLDQNPIGHTIRSDVSTYVDLLTPLRQFFAKLPLAAAKGLQPRHFSYNHKKGMCKSCYGLGFKMVELQFLPSVKVCCEACSGMRLNPLSLQVKYKDNNLGELLQVSLAEAKDLLPPVPKILKTLEVLEEVGLSYLELGQEIASLSGGEAQRLRLSRELVKRSQGKTLYLFDEPTIGLHSDDIKKLLAIFEKLVNQGNTVIVIEHNLDVLAQADEIIDLGPKGGKYGGTLIAQCPPEKLIQHPTSLTGHYLQSLLKKAP